jgi:hypothetical protein
MSTTSIVLIALLAVLAVLYVVRRRSRTTVEDLD